MTSPTFRRPLVGVWGGRGKLSDFFGQDSKWTKSDKSFRTRPWVAVGGRGDKVGKRTTYGPYGDTTHPDLSVATATGRQLVSLSVTFGSHIRETTFKFIQYDP